METILHIGQHKTGTTSLQKYLQQNKTLLEAKGVYVTNRILDYVHSSHYILNVYALAKNRSSTMKDRIVKEKGANYLERLDIDLPSEMKRIYEDAMAKNCSRVIWSNEGLYFLNSEEEYLKLVELFRPYSSKVTVICCFREKNSFRQAYTKQLAKRGINQTQEVDSYRNLADDSWLFDYDRKKNLLAKTFDDHLYFDYNPKDSVKPFMQLLNIPMDGTLGKRLNVTPTKGGYFKAYLVALLGKMKSHYKKQ